MAKREYHGEPIDLTDGPGESHLSDKNGETVAGTTEDDNYDTKTDAWPSALPRNEFSPAQQEIVEKLVVNPNISDSKLAEVMDCSSEYVRQVRHKVSAYLKPDAVPFRVPDDPTKSIKIVKRSLDNDGDLPRESGEESKSQTAESGQNDDSAADEELPRQEIKRLYKEGCSHAEIASAVGCDRNRVSGLIGGMKRHGIVGEQPDSSRTTNSTEDTEEVVENSEETDTESPDEVDDEQPNLSLSISQVVEIMDAPNVSKQTKRDILQQGDFE